MCEEAEAIKAAALDYLEGWYTADTSRIERGLHPEFIKRVVIKQKGDLKFFSTSFKDFLTRVPQMDRPKFNPVSLNVEIFDIHEHIATVKTTSPDFIDYLHLAKWDGQWKIVNVLWSFTARAREDRGLEQVC